MANSEQNQKKWAQIVAKAWMDEEFKQKLINDPKQTLTENGIEFGKASSFRIVQAEAGEVCFVLPAKPEGSLSEEELKNIAAAGAAWCGDCWGCAG